MEQENWFLLDKADDFESPALIFYEDRINGNITMLKSMIGDLNRLRPHVKTHKSSNVSRLMLEAGIKKFKCATIAEAEMLARVEAPDVLLAYQPVGPNIQRLLALQKQFSGTKFSCLVDNLQTATELAAAFHQQGAEIGVYIDLNVGMNRTGIDPQYAFELYRAIRGLLGLKILGLHAYDGHIHAADYSARQQQADVIISVLRDLSSQIESLYQEKPVIIAGGTPTFPIYAQIPEFECSPGTFALWDKGYQDAFPEQPFKPAALLISRVVSLPTGQLICTDLGHKAVAAENPLDKRVYFLKAPQLKVVSQSEEHLVLDAGPNHNFRIGDLLYGLPHHICPTVALYESAYCVSTSRPVEIWPITSRKRKLSI
jgi:D-serine deaminase-like pyridoxal phosphate-dependent protein